MESKQLRDAWKTIHDSHPSWFRWAGRAALVLLLLMIIGSVTHAHAKRSKSRRTVALQGEWAALEGCLLGASLGERESPSSRFRGIQLTVLGTPRAARSTANEAAWPVRCASFARGVADRADALGVASVDVRIPMKALATALQDDVDATADLGKLVDETWKAARTTDVLSDRSASPANPASAPKPTLPALAADALTASPSFAGDFDLKSVVVDPAPSANLRFLLDDRRLAGGALICAASGAPITLSCDHPAKEVGMSSPGLELVGTTDVNAFPWLFAGDRGQLGVYDPSGKLVLRGPAWGASVGPDDSAFFLVHQPGGAPNRLGLVVAPRNGVASDPKPVLDANELARPGDATLAWSWLIDWGGPQAKLPHHLVARALGALGEVGPAIDIGDVPGEEPAVVGLADTERRFTACRSGSHLAIRLHGAREDALTFYTGVAWTTPVALRIQGGDLVCEQNEAVATRVTHADRGAVVEQSRCNASGCKESRVGLRDLLAGTDVMPLAGAENFAATELDEQLLLVWNAGPVGGLRMRLASNDMLKERGDILLADTLKATPEAAVTNVRLVAAAEEAMLFVKTVGGVHLFGVDRGAKLLALSGRMR